MAKIEFGKKVVDGNLIFSLYACVGNFVRGSEQHRADMAICQKGGGASQRDTNIFLSY